MHERSPDGRRDYAGAAGGRNIVVNDLVDEKLDHTLAFFAKLLCSGVFVVGRDPQEFLREDLHTHVRAEGMPISWGEITVEVDFSERKVSLAARGVQRSAVFNDYQGCTIVPRSARGRELHFTPQLAPPRLSDPPTALWPAGDEVQSVLPTDVDADRLRAALELALDDRRQPEPQYTRALAVVYRGQLIAEAYAPGFGPDTRHVSWSMGKSITAALVGILVGQGCFVVDDPAPIAEWQAPGDPRRAITIRHLLNMSSGLAFIRAQDEDRLELGWTSRDDHMFIYFGAVDVFRHSVTRQLADPPGTVWRYRNCDTLTLGAIVRRTVEARGQDYLLFPQRALFDRIGIGRMVLEVDPWGNFIMTGFDYGTARDWARFGLLHLRDGVWDGERVLPEGWIRLIRTPAPANLNIDYGGQFWLNAGGRLPNVPLDAYWPAGAWVQAVFIIPSRDIVVVRLGHSSVVRDTSDAYFDRTIADVLSAIGD
jgi:CubicO group peptidase (beta-lactamase class C family)